MTRLALIALMLSVACAPPPVSREAWQRYNRHRLDTPAAAIEQDPALVNLGRQLYFDEGLSLNGQVSCNTCHDAATTGVDPNGLPKSLGATGAPSGTNAPTIFNMAGREWYGWKADADDLDVLLLRPLNNFHALRDQDVDALVRDLGYAEELERLTGPWASSEQAKQHVVMAIKAYTLTLVSNDSPFDRFVGTSYEDRDLTAMSADAQRGAALFVGRAFCDECHTGARFTNDQAVNIGVGDHASRAARWRVAPLRDVSVGGPWFHDGSIDKLIDVLWHYVDGGDSTFGDDQHVAIQPLDLSGDDLQDLLAFLDALRGTPLPYCHVTPDDACCENGQPIWDEGNGKCQRLAADHARRP